MSVTSLRYAHTEGHCNINYVPNSKIVATCGADGEVRVFSKGITADDSNSHLIGDEVFAMACTSQNKVYVAPSGTNTIRAYTLDEGVNDGLVARFTADITCMDINNEKGDILVAGSADMTIKVVNTESYEVIATFEGHLAPILSVSIDSNGLYAASSSCDGTIRIWSIKEKKQVQMISDAFPKSNDFSNSVTLAEVAWKPCKDFTYTLAISFKTSISIFNKNEGTSQQWSKTKDLKPKKEVLQPDEYFNVVSFSKSDYGAYVVAGTTKGKICIWQFSSGNIVVETKSTSGHEYGICSIDFCPVDTTEAAFIDSNGYWGVIENIPSGTPTANQSAIIKEKRQPVSRTENENELNEDELAAALFEDDDDDNENSFSIRKIKAETGFLNGEADENDDEIASTFGDKYVGDTIADADTESNVGQVVTDAKKTIVNSEINTASISRQRNFEFDVQEPFQPGSTPIHLHSRFMVWNSVGIVKSFTSEDEKSIDIEFHDTAIHHPIHLSNVRGYTMAALTDKCLALACDADDSESADEENSDSQKSKLLCHYFGSSDISKEWSIEMPNHEEIMAVACGDGWIAVATDRRNLRIFTCGGTQLDILSLPGPVVSLAGYKKQIAITVHLGLGLPGNQLIGIAILNIGEKSHPLPNYSHLPLAPKSILSWIGFTDQGTPCIMDSAGFIRILNNNYGAGGWIQVCNTKAQVKGKSDHFFLVGVNEHSFSARAILVKGSRFPQTVPRPVVALVNLSIPLCTSTVQEKDVLEASYWKFDVKARAYENNPNEFDEDITANRDSQNQCLVKLFALACKSDHESRAMEICKLMDLQTIQIAIQYASKIRRLQLATKISELAGYKQDEETRLLNARKNNDHDRQKGNNEDNESQDMFYPTQDGILSEDLEEKTPTNPFLAAKFRKENSYSAQARLQSSNNSFSPDIVDNRNPFKKNLTPQSGNIRSGLVFDGMSKEDGLAKGSQNSSYSFGSRPPVRLPTSKSLSKQKQGLITKKAPADINESSTGKENVINLQTCEVVLKGFQLWFEENKEDLSLKEETSDPTELQNLALQQWKSMTKVEKEKYKEPRTPNFRTSKRKFEATDNESKKDSDLSITSNKLAKFCAPE